MDLVYRASVNLEASGTDDNCAIYPEQQQLMEGGGGDEKLRFTKYCHSIEGGSL